MGMSEHCFVCEGSGVICVETEELCGTCRGQGRIIDSEIQRQAREFVNNCMVMDKRFDELSVSKREQIAKRLTEDLLDGTIEDLEYALDPRFANVIQK